MKVCFIMALMLLAACSTPGREERLRVLRNQGSFDLGCPANHVGVEYVEPDKYNVNGCGRQKIYKYEDGKIKG